MGNAKYIGRVGALTVALGAGNVRHAATRMTVSIGAAAVVVMATVVPVPGSTVSPAVRLSADSTALILGGTTVPTPDNAYITTVRDHFIAPTHPGQDITYVPVTAPMELWPATGAARLIWLATGPQSVWGLDGPGWPDEPLWKLSGLFDVTFDQSVQGGVTALEQSMAAHGNDHLVIFGYSQGAMIANREKQKLAEQYPAGTTAPDISFVLIGDENLPNGGLAARFPGLYIPIVNLTFYGPAPTNTQFHTVEVIRQYDGFADFPLYPINVIADANAILGILYVHSRDLDPSLADPSVTPVHTTTGDTDYYFYPTENLPLFEPLRTLGVPEPVIDVVEPVFKVLVEQGYDRSIPPGTPTPARLIPMHDPATVASDLVDAIGEGIDNAAALIGAPTPLGIPAAPGTNLNRVGGRDVDDGISQVPNAVDSPLPQPPAITHNYRQVSQRGVGQEVAAARNQINDTIGAVRSVVGDGRTAVRAAGSDNGSPAATTSPQRKTPVRDAAKKASGDIKKFINKVSDSIHKALSGGTGDDNHTAGGGQGGAQ